MPKALLLDTGAWVALIDRSERYHEACVAVLEGWVGPVYRLHGQRAFQILPS